MGLSHTVSGDIASFRTPSRVPIESLKFHFLPKQAAGTPSPENPIPIEGWTGLNGYGAGFNILLFDSVISEGYTRTLDGLTVTCSNGIAHITGDHNKSTWTNIIDFYSVWSSSPIVLPPGTYTTSNGLTVVCKVDDADSYANYGYTFTVEKQALVRGFYAAIMGEVTVDKYIPLVLTVGAERPKTYLPYKPIINIPITFPSNGKNIVDWPTPNGFSVATSLFNGWNDNWFREPIYVYRSNFGKNIIYSATIDNTNGIRDAYLHVWVKDKNESYVSSGIASEIVPVGSSKRVYAVVPITSASWYKIYLGLTIGSGCIVSNPMAEYSMSMTDYEPYSSDNTFYGGYIDPVAGEIVAEYALYETTWGSNSAGTVLGDTKRKGFYVRSVEFADAIDLHNNGQGPYGKYRRTLCNIVPWGWDYFSDYPHYYINNHDINLMMPVDTTDDTVIQFCARLKTPIHIPIPAEDLQAFLDYNNFWSDTNGITEVTYAVTESKDILDARKRIYSYNIGDYIKDGLVLWMDGIDKGNVQGAWVDKINGHIFNPENSPIMSNNYVLFNGNDQGFKCNTFDGFGCDNGTIEICMEIDNSKGSGIAFMSKEGGLSFGIVNSYSIIWSSGVSGHNEYYKPMINLPTPASSNKIYSICYDRSVVDGALKPFSSGEDYWSGIDNTYSYIGHRNRQDSMQYFKGKIYSIRIYNRKLSEAEMLHNQRIDNRRFKLGISTLN